MEPSHDYSINNFNVDNFNMFQPDFIPEPDFENLILAIQCPNADPIEKFCLDYTCNHFMNSAVELQLPQTPCGLIETVNGVGAGAEAETNDVVGTDIGNGTDIGIGICTSNDIGCYDVMDPNSNLLWDQEEEDVKIFGDENSLETATTGPNTPRGKKGGTKGDRTRTLISERKRRSGMKEKLYALRSLVPNITKMDKASIVGDAARYIHDLQTQAKNLRTEIAAIEATKNQKMSPQNSNKIHVSNSLPILKKISKLDMFQVEEKGYYVRLVCNKGRGIAVSLHRALESITSFQVQSSNLATVDDNFVLTFTLNVTACEFDINLPNLKLWLSGAFLNQGFEFNSFPSP